MVWRLRLNDIAVLVHFIGQFKHFVARAGQLGRIGKLGLGGHFPRLRVAAPLGAGLSRVWFFFFLPVLRNNSANGSKNFLHGRFFL